ncbi:MULTISPECIES: ZIP family metal transporter [unclassified Lysinibacillus]|uniref:ZIP family metal transporter n=1 Tax=unclassified Lysinibacillus TaxID=2636778 RepID=UPI00131EEDC9|nr:MULTISPECIES: ZIP family metal transporter [unclassified Lysinibacillus]
MYYLGIISFIATVIGIGIGGLFALFLKKFQQSIANVYAICAGMILGLIYLEIAPESIKLGGWPLFTLGFSTGVFLFFIIHKASHIIIRVPDNQNRDSYILTGLFLMFSISLHNFPLGIAFGSTQNLGLSNSVLHTIILHNIPEGIAMFTPFLLAKIKFHASLLISIIVSLPVGIGAILGRNIGLDYPLLWAFIISSAIGMMIIVTIKEIYFEALKQSSVAYSLIMAGFGVMIIWAYLRII